MEFGVFFVVVVVDIFDKSFCFQPVLEQNFEICEGSQNRHSLSKTFAVINDLFHQMPLLQELFDKLS